MSLVKVDQTIGGFPSNHLNTTFVIHNNWPEGTVPRRKERDLRPNRLPPEAVLGVLGTTTGGPGVDLGPSGERGLRHVWGFWEGDERPGLTRGWTWRELGAIGSRPRTTQKDRARGGSPSFLGGGATPVFGPVSLGATSPPSPS